MSGAHLLLQSATATTLLSPAHRAAHAVIVVEHNLVSMSQTLIIPHPAAERSSSCRQGWAAKAANESKISKSSSEGCQVSCLTARVASSTPPSATSTNVIHRIPVWQASRLGPTKQHDRAST